MGRLSQVLVLRMDTKLLSFQCCLYNSWRIGQQLRNLEKEFGLAFFTAWRCKTLRLGNPVAEGGGGLRKILQTNFGRGATFFRGLALRRAQTLDTICANVKPLYRSHEDIIGNDDIPLNSSLSKSRFGTRVQRLLHRFDKRLLITACLVVRKERIWQRRDSGRLLILSTIVDSSSSSFWRF